MSTGTKGLIGLCAVLVLFIIIWGAFIVTIPNGYVGIIYDASRGGVLDKDLTPGWHSKNPFTQTITEYPTAFRTYTMSRKAEEGARNGDDSIKVTTSDNQVLYQDVSVTYRIIPGKGQMIYRDFKGASIETIEDSFIRRSIITAVATKAGPSYAILDAYGAKKNAFEKDIITELDGILKAEGFEVVTVNLGEGHVDNTVKEAIEKPLRAQTEAKEAEAQLATKQAQAQQQVINAQAYSDALKIKSIAEADANKRLSESLTPLLVDKMRIEKLNPNVQVMYVPSTANIFTGLSK